MGLALCPGLTDRCVSLWPSQNATATIAAGTLNLSPRKLAQPQPARIAVSKPSSSFRTFPGSAASEVVEASQATPQISSTPATKRIRFFDSQGYVAFVLGFLGALEIVGSPIVGMAIGVESDALRGWGFFAAAFMSGLICIGFAGIIENSHDCARRLGRLEALMQKASEGKKD